MFYHRVSLADDWMDVKKQYLLCLYLNKFIISLIKTADNTFDHLKHVQIFILIRNGWR